MDPGSPASPVSPVTPLHALHCEVPACNWCVTREDLEEFERDVRAAFKNGDFKEDPRYPNPGHNDPWIGPTIYEVNEKYIKPRTLKEGGMSWAMMKHKEDGGCECDVFATHAWCEGVFEFLRKVRRAWPTDAKFLYACFLANPQNSDISEMVCRPDDSPFAQALKKARYMIVIPNKAKSIYSRLWCVFEAFKAIKETEERGLIILLPSEGHAKEVAVQIAPGLVLFCIGTYLSFHFIAPITVSSGRALGNLIGPAMWQLNAYVMWSVLRKALTSAFGVSMSDPRKQATFEYCGFFFTGCATGVSMWNLGFTPFAVLDNPFRVHRLEPGEKFPVLFLIAALILEFIFNIVIIFYRHKVRKEGNQLYVGSVRDAECENKDDEIGIRAAISEKEDEVDRAIQMLRKLGRYDKAIKHNLELGMSEGRARDGVSYPKVVTACIAWQFWWITDLNAAKYYICFCAIPAVLITVSFFIVKRAGNYAIVPTDSMGLFGIVFLLASNSPIFFTKKAVQSRNMSGSTFWLQIVCFLACVITNVCYFQGCWKTWKEKFTLIKAAPISSPGITKPLMADQRVNSAG